MRLRPGRLSLLVLALASAAAVEATRVRRHGSEQFAQQHFDELAARVSKGLLAQLRTYAYGLRGARGAVIAAGGETITRERFLAYSRSRRFDEEFPGARGYGFIRRVPAEQLVDFVRGAQEEGRPFFQVRQFVPNDGDRFIVQYIEPEARNREAVGLDLASEPRRREAALRAMRSDEPTLSAPIPLVQGGAQDGAVGVILLLPLLRDVDAATPAAREAATFGWAYAPLVIAEVLGALDGFDTNFSAHLRDVTQGDEPLELYAYAPREHESTALRRVVPLELYGRTWQLEMVATPRFLESLHLLPPHLFETFAGSAAVLLAGLVYLIASSLERRREAARAHARLAALVETSQDAIIATDLDGVVLSWNLAAERLFGYTAQEATGHHLVSLIVPSERAEEDVTVLHNTARGEFVPTFTTERHRKDGSKIDVSVTVSPIRDPDGSIVGTSKVLRDISAQRSAETRIVELNRALEQQVDRGSHQIAELSERLELATRAGNIGVWDWHLDTGEFIADGKMFALYGLDPARDTFDSQTWRRLVVPEDFPRFETQLNEALSFAPELRIEFRVRRADGSEGALRATALVVRDSEGKALRLVGINQDVTETYRAQCALREAKEAAEAASRTKSQFLANMSHEIRTPLNAIIGLSSLLRDAALPGASREHAELIRKSGEHLLSIINDLLDYSKIEAGRLELEHQAFNLLECVESAIELVAASAASKRVELGVLIEPGVPESIIGDVGRLRQVLVNLLSNGVRFTQARGYVLVHVRAEPAASQAQRISIEVADNGVGIPAEVQRRLFRPFVQADASTTRMHGGTGLGLSICRKLVKLMGGQIELHSEEGSGARFRFHFDAEVVRDDTFEPERVALAARVLVVDDGGTTFKIASHYAPEWGITVEHAASSVDALRLLEDGTFDAVLLDGDGVIDAIELGRRIRAMVASRDIAMILLSAAAPEPLDAVFDLALAKPIRPLRLLARLTELIAPARRAELFSSRPAPIDEGQTDATLGRRHPLRILVAEDNPVNQRVAQLLLQKLGYVADLAADGDEVLLALDRQPYDLILMDIQMPNRDGLDATREIVNRFAANGRPRIVGLSANAMPEHEQAARAAGMDDYLTKPLELAALQLALLKTERSGLIAQPEAAAV